MKFIPNFNKMCKRVEGIYEYVYLGLYISWNLLWIITTYMNCPANLMKLYIMELK